MLKTGDKAPAIMLLDQHGKKVSLKDFAKKEKYCFIFIRKADTPGLHGSVLLVCGTFERVLAKL